jgi:hypothetical protein
MAIIGLPIRTVHGMAARAEIPGAAKFGRRWTFDLARLRKWIELREHETCLSANQKRRQAATGTAGRFTPVTVRPAARREGTPGPYTQVIRALRGSGSKRGKAT